MGPGNGKGIAGADAEANRLLDGLAEMTSRREWDLLAHSLLLLLVEGLELTQGVYHRCRCEDGVWRWQPRWRLGEEAPEHGDAAWKRLPARLLPLCAGKLRLRWQGCLWLALSSAERVYGLLQLKPGAGGFPSSAQLDALLRIHENYSQLLSEAGNDRLTGLYNRRSFEQCLYEHPAEQAGTLALLDVDFFKRINDLHGHPAGDAVLVALARALEGAMREQDRAFRFGGEEFALWLPGLDAERAQDVLERLRRLVEGMEFPAGLRLTLSVGHTQLDACRLPVQLLEEADRALYYVKSHGRNQVRGFGELVGAGALAPPKSGDIDLFFDI